MIKSQSETSMEHVFDFLNKDDKRNDVLLCLHFYLRYKTRDIIRNTSYSF